MKLYHHISNTIAALIVALTASAAAEQLYTCGMHPQIIKPEPGSCPVCSMALTPVRQNAASAGAIHVSPGIVQLMNLKTETVSTGPIRREIRNVGTIAYNEEGLSDITIKYEGWIETLHVNATWTAVKKGDPLFEMYSPDLYNAQLNYLVALRSEKASPGPLLRAATERLKLFDLPQEFIDQLANEGKAQRLYTFRSPADGVVIEKMAVAGQMIKPGERIFRLADLSTVWVHAQIFENNLPFVRAGQAATVRVTYGRDRDLPATVALILPQVEAQTRTATARLVLPNPDGTLRPGMFVDVRLSSELPGESVLVSETAVLRSGMRNTIFLANADGTFEPREIELGLRSHDGRYEVLSGLTGGERVVTSGQFMLDSESQLREAIQKMLKTSAAKAPVAALENPGALAALAFALADAAAPLAADDLAGYRKQLPAVREALAAYLKNDPKGPLAAYQSGPSDPADLKSAQKAFAPFSTAVADLARAHHVHHQEGLRLFQCPMAPGIGEGRWLQRDAKLQNPFFGSAMLTCGDELDAPR